MSDIQRYNTTHDAEQWNDEEGPWVLYDDHLFETKRLREALDSINRIVGHGLNEWEDYEAGYENLVRSIKAALATAEQQNTNKE